MSLGILLAGDDGRNDVGTAKAGLQALPQSGRRAGERSISQPGFGVVGERRSR